MALSGMTSVRLGGGELLRADEDWVREKQIRVEGDKFELRERLDVTSEVELQRRHWSVERSVEGRREHQFWVSGLQVVMVVRLGSRPRLAQVNG